MSCARSRYISIGIFVCTMGFQSLSQTCCSAGAPLNSAFDISGGGQRALILNLEYNYKSINRLVSQNETLQNDPRDRNGSNYILRTDYIASERLAFAVVMPYVLQNRSTTSEDQGSKGIGDIVLLAQYSSKVKEDLQLKFSGGLKLPTGVETHSDSRGITLSPDMQSGSGTFDFISRVSAIKQHFLFTNFSSQVGVLFRKNTRNPDFGAVGGGTGRNFKFGDEFVTDLTFSYQALLGLWFVAPDLGIRYWTRTSNQEQKRAAPNSGGQWMSMSLGVFLRPNEAMGIRLYSEVPFYQKLKGLQITTNLELGVQLNYTFDLSKDRHTIPLQNINMEL